jgi:hypothetical protein
METKSFSQTLKMGARLLSRIVTDAVIGRRSENFKFLAGAKK